MTEEQHEILIRIDERVGQLVEKTEDQEQRLRALERFKNWAMAVLGLGASGVGISQKM